MTGRSDFIALGLASFVALCGAALAAGAPAWAIDSMETSAGEADPALAQARALIEAGDYETALGALRALQAQAPENADLLNLIGFSLRKTGQPDAALDYYRRALALEPDHLGANEYLGELYLELGRPSEARQRVEALRAACADCEE